MDNLDKSLCKSLDQSKTKEYRELYTSADECYILDDSESEKNTFISPRRISVESINSIVEDFNNINKNKGVTVNKILCDKFTNTDSFFYLKNNQNITNSNHHTNIYNNLESKDEQKCSCKKLFKSIFTFCWK